MRPTGHSGAAARILSCPTLIVWCPIRLAGTCARYSKSAIPHDTIAATYHALDLSQQDDLGDHRHLFPPLVLSRQLDAHHAEERTGDEASFGIEHRQSPRRQRARTAERPRQHGRAVPPVDPFERRASAAEGDEVDRPAIGRDQGRSRYGAAARPGPTGRPRPGIPDPLREPPRCRLQRERGDVWPAPTSWERSSRAVGGASGFGATTFAPHPRSSTDAGRRSLATFARVKPRRPAAG